MIHEQMTFADVLTSAKDRISIIAAKYGLDPQSLVQFAERIATRGQFDPAELTDLLAPLSLPWKARLSTEELLVLDLTPTLKLMSLGEVRGLDSYLATLKDLPKPERS